MCGILGVVAKNPVNQLLYDGLLVLQHRGQDAAGIVTAEGATFHMHKGSGMVRDVFRTRNMRALLGSVRHCPHALSDRRLGVVGGRGAAVLRQFAVRHRARPQRQPDQYRPAQKRAVPPGPAPRQHQFRFRGAAQRAGARAAGGRGQLQARPGDHFRRGIGRAPALPRRLCGRGDDRRLRPARVPRSLRHPAAGVRQARNRARHRIPGRLRVRRARCARVSSWCATSRRAKRSSSTRTAIFTRSSARSTRRSTRASSSTSIWRGRTR